MKKISEMKKDYKKMIEYLLGEGWDYITCNSNDGEVTGIMYDDQEYTTPDHWDESYFVAYLIDVDNCKSYKLHFAIPEAEDGDDPVDGIDWTTPESFYELEHSFIEDFIHYHNL